MKPCLENVVAFWEVKEEVDGLVQIVGKLFVKGKPLSAGYLIADVRVPSGVFNEATPEAAMAMIDERVALDLQEIEDSKPEDAASDEFIAAGRRLFGL